MKGALLKYVLIISVILGIAFLSQNVFSWANAKTFVYDAVGQAKAYLGQGSNWAAQALLPSLSGEVQKRGEMIKDEVITEKEKISESVGEKIKNYFSGIADSVINPGKNSNCNCPSQPAQTQTQTWYSGQ